MRILFFIVLSFTLIISSCRTQRQVTKNYLQDTSDTTINDITRYQPPVIQKGDLLSIRVFSEASGLRPEADAPYNLPDEVNSGSLGSTGFLVDNAGNIEYPKIGLVHVEGLTREDLSTLIKTKLEGQLINPSVLVRFLNFKISVLGEVANPGTYTMPTERVNIFEAIGMAGDVTEFGLKNNVKVIRESEGQVNIAIVDLTSKELFTSPYYRLQQNDILVIEQSVRKIRQQERQETAQQIGLATSIITAIALILNFIR